MAMECVLPPELADRALLEHIDGEAGRDVADHIARCVHCSQRADELSRLQSRLRSRLYRAPCPSTLELGEFQLDLASEEAAAQVSAHVSDCPYCARETARLALFLAQPLPVPKVSALRRSWGRWTRMVKSLVARVREGDPSRRRPILARPSLAHVGVRGVEEALVYEAGDVQVAIEIQDDPQAHGRKTLLGLVTGADATGLQAFLSRDERSVSEGPVDELGNFVLKGVVPGVYGLRLSGPETDVRIDDVQVGAG